MKIKEIIVEALTPYQTAQLYRDLGNKYDHKIVQPGIFGGEDRIYEPLKVDSKVQYTNKSLSIQSALQSALQPMGYEIDDYAAGIAHLTSNPTRRVKIGGLASPKYFKDSEKLHEFQRLVQLFAADKERAGSRQTEPMTIVYSRDPVDIAGMSTDRGWTSCMNLDKGGYNKDVPTEIKNGAIIAYLVRNSDRNIDKPMARILIKPYYKDKDIILIPSQLYGTAPRQFSASVNAFCRKFNLIKPEGEYEIPRDSYVDRQVTRRQNITNYENMDIGAIGARKQLALAQDTFTAPEVLTAMTLWSDDNYNMDGSVLEALAQNESTPGAALRLLATSNKPFVRKAVASNENTPPESLSVLATDTDFRVYAEVAGNVSTPKDVLTVLSTHDKHTRARVANNRNTAPETLTALATDTESVAVREGVANNINTPASGMAVLATDDDYRIRKIVATKTKFPKILALMATDDDPALRQLVATNDNTTADTLARMTNDDEPEVRKAVALNPRITPHVLAILAKDRNHEVLQHVSDNPKTPPEALVTLTTNLYWLYSASIRASVAKNPMIPVNILTKLATDKEDSVRLAVATNPSTNMNLLSVLVTDKDPAVKEAAQMSMQQKTNRR